MVQFRESLFPLTKFLRVTKNAKTLVVLLIGFVYIKNSHINIYKFIIKIYVCVVNILSSHCVVNHAS